LKHPIRKIHDKTYRNCDITVSIVFIQRPHLSGPIVITPAATDDATDDDDDDDDNDDTNDDDGNTNDDESITMTKIHRMRRSLS
jgi:hypothetical protein